MSQPTSLQHLPAELIQTILQIVCQEDYEEYQSKLEDDDSAAPPRLGFSGPTLLASIHISTRIRAMALSHPPLWRSIARKVDLLVATRKHRNTIALLRLCSDRSAEDPSAKTLTSANFKRNKNAKTDCSKAMLDLLQLMKMSSASLRSIYFPLFPRRGLEPCHCFSCATEGQYVKVKAVWILLVDLLQHAPRLDCLDINLHDFRTPPNLLQQTTAILAQPAVLKLRLAGDRGLTEERVGFICKLAGQATELHLWLSSNLFQPLPLYPAALLLNPVVESSLPTLRNLRLAGSISRLAVLEALRHDLSLLEELQIDIDHPHGNFAIPALTGPKVQLRSLKTLQTPSWLVHLLSTPAVESVAISVLHQVDEDAIIDALVGDWWGVHDLVLHFSLHSQEEVTRFVSALLRFLTPDSSDDDFGPPCCMLRSLGITSRKVDFFKWIKAKKDDGRSEDLDDDDDAEQALWGSFPIIGNDLYSLARRREEAYFKSEPLSEENEADPDKVPLCWPLDCIRVLDCLLDSSAWTWLREDAARLNDRRWCYPDPTVVHNALTSHGRYDLLSQVAEILYHLNRA